MPRTRRYSIEIKELRFAIAQNLRLAGLPDDGGLTAPANDEDERPVTA